MNQRSTISVEQAAALSVGMEISIGGTRRRIVGITGTTLTLRPCGWWYRLYVRLSRWMADWDERFAERYLR